MRSMALAFFCSCAALTAQHRFPEIPGFNVGLNPNAVTLFTVHHGQPALLVLIPGGESIATFHDPKYLPPTTLKVELAIAQWGVYETQSCAPGARLFFDTNYPGNVTPNATLATTGWNLFGPHSYPLSYVPTEPFYSTWLMTYCNVMQCTSPCGPAHRDPVWEAYLFVPRIY